MMKITQYFFIVSVITLILTGCQNNQAKNASGGVFIGGTKGLTASFEPLGIKENNVYAIYDTEGFPLEVLLKNQGEETIAPGKVSLKLLGPAPTDFQHIPSWTITNQQSIDKVSNLNPQGGEEIVSFTPGEFATLSTTKQVTGFTDVNWNVEYAYDYKTHVVINDVCFKGDITDTKVCQVKEAKKFFVSGAPLTVTTVEQDTAGKGLIALKITVQNAGTGSATFPDGEFDTRFSQAAYTIEEPSAWECKSGGRENQVRFVGNSGQVFCKLKQPLREEELYTKSLEFTLNYKYKELIQEKLRIKESIE